MRILVAANLTPFLKGGADDHIVNLTRALTQAGHQVETLRLPFAFNPVGDIRRAMQAARDLDMHAPSGQGIDRLISLQFPAYGVRHPHHVAWVMHQHRAVYELFNPQKASAEDHALKAEIEQFDQDVLGPVSHAGRLFANSQRVADRLKKFNNLDAQPIYHPPPDQGRFFCESPEHYIFFPSRFEHLKRQWLVIEAAALMKSPLTIVLAGEGGQFDAARQHIAELGVGDRVKLLGRISAEEKIVCYSRALAVCFPPFDEDLGYVTLEAMLSSKPVITCTDSGGPCEFVVHEETGLVVEPTPAALAVAMDGLLQNRARATEMGSAALARWRMLNISWSSVVDRLLKA
ncbi:MAG: glycosyltransferase family 4 protein [Burkholderiaceae bacterium]|nr:glycosyltransferase family 4 protein [Burkholderiaceae bacterium]